jgi:DNA ligase-1
MYASVKLDGIRAVVRDGMLLSRSLKPIPNWIISSALSKPIFEGLDGELIVGPTTSPTCYRDTVSGVMSEDKSPDWTFHVFDQYKHGEPFDARMDRLEATVRNMGTRIARLEQKLVHDIESLNEFEAKALEAGHEGVILRHPKSPYKFGRSTAKEGYLLKVKRFVDGEAEIIGFEEEMFNGNEATTNELGRTARSSHKSGLIGKGTLGALQVKDAKTAVEFSIGTGFTAEQRQHIWNNRDKLLGTLRKYKSFPIGVKDKPRHPVDLGPRDVRDLS